MSDVIRWLRRNGDIDALLLRRLKDNRAEQIIHPHWWLGGRFVAVLSLNVTTVYSLARYIVVPEEKGSNLICISAIGATAGERFCMQHPVPNCPSTMAVDDLRFY